MGTLHEVEDLLRHVHEKPLTMEERQEQAVVLAALLLKVALAEQTGSERRRNQQLARLMADPAGKLFTTQMTDQCFRSDNASRVVDQLRYLIRVFGIPQYLGISLQTGLRSFKSIGRFLPRPALYFLQKALRRELSNVVVPAESGSLTDYLKKRYREDTRVNLNYLGEAILGDKEAANRLDVYLAALKRPDVEYISVKISTLASQLNLLAWEDTLELLAEPLRRLYSTAAAHTFVRPDGTVVPKFVNLDMEEYRDLLLTVSLFKKVLEEPAFMSCNAGIVLQSYLPDAYALQKELTSWAERRYRRGGAPIKIRIVKGANLAMEQVEASLRGWPQAPYTTKWESDANFKRMLLYGCDPTHAAIVHLGVGSHNLLDIAYALLLRAERQLEAMMTFEMLEGMAPALQRVIHRVSGDLLVYSPAVDAGHFHTAVAYLMRRLDENTAPENFLSTFFSMEPGNNAWDTQVDYFLRSCDAVDEIGSTPRRRQRRDEEIQAPTSLELPFINEPDTDWSLPVNRTWLMSYLERWRARACEEIPLVIDGEQVGGEETVLGSDPSRPRHLLYRYQNGDGAAVRRAVTAAVNAQKSWWDCGFEGRSHILATVATELRRRRGELISAMVADAGKTVAEADVEVSEAIDFCEYYRRSAVELASLEDVNWQSLGTVLVVPPWNFSCSIAVGGIAAALAAGNTVIYKPPPETVLVGWIVAQAFWQAGVDKKTLQFITGQDDVVGSALVESAAIDGILLTGATATAQKLLKMRPGIHLIGETGGKNSIIVTALADRDQAVRAIVTSAFGHAGQKCSACSLLICLKEVYEDPHFRSQLADAASSLPVGSAWDLKTEIPPLIRPAGDALLAALTTLEKGEEWLLQPKQSATNPLLWSPGIKLGVTTQSPCYRNELFGPVLAVMCASDLPHALLLANGTPYGLTAGIQSLDIREQRYWLCNIVAGNCYINRTITGAIVQRQPFGGCKASNYGGGAKAGGPNYLTQLMRVEQRGLPQLEMAVPAAVSFLDNHVTSVEISEEERSLWHASIGSYAFFWYRYFAMDHDASDLLGEDNILRYIPRHDAILRISKDDSIFNVVRVVAAALTVGCPLEISTDVDFADNPLLQGPWRQHCPSIHFVIETVEALASRLTIRSINGIRYLSQPSEEDVAALAAAGVAIVVAPVLANGRLELLHYLREVTISNSYHRYGYLGDRDNNNHPAYNLPAGCCFGSAAPAGCCGNGECDQM